MQHTLNMRTGESILKSETELFERNSIGQW